MALKRIKKDIDGGFYRVQVKATGTFGEPGKWRTVYVSSIYQYARMRLDNESGTEAA